VTFTAPAGVTVEYRLDGGATTPYTGTTIAVAGDGVHTLSYDASDGSQGDLVIPIDTTGPTITTTFRTYALGSTGNAFDVTCADSGSGLASCTTTPSAPDTSTVGIKSFSVHATDRVGNSADATGTYDVAWPFRGFLDPLSNPPVLNVVKAGQGVPVRFSLGGNRGLAIIAAGYPQSQPIACDSNAPLDTSIPATTSGGSTLTYDAATDAYTYVWKTDKSFTGCRQLVLKLVDGSEHVANFKFG
jgi:hypothetical protein